MTDRVDFIKEAGSGGIEVAEKRCDVTDDKRVGRGTDRHHDDREDILDVAMGGNVTIPNRCHRHDRSVKRSDILGNRIGVLDPGYDHPAVLTLLYCSSKKSSSPPEADQTQTTSVRQSAGGGPEAFIIYDELSSPGTDDPPSISSARQVPLSVLLLWRDTFAFGPVPSARHVTKSMLIIRLTCRGVVRRTKTETYL
jgi:hypothetical protein